MKIGITGAAGHLGATICRRLLEKGYEVVAFVYKDVEALKDLPITLVRGDVLDRASLKTFISECDAVIHAASSIELSYKFEQKTYDVNVIGTKNILEIAKEVKTTKLVYISSVHVFRQKPYDIPLDENRQFVSDDSVFYDQTKRDAHILAEEAAQNGQDVVIVCPSAVLGPNDYKPSKLGKAIIDIYKGKFPALFKGGFDFVDVRDIADGTIAALEKGRSGETYILSGQYHTIKELSNFVFEAKGVNKKLVALPLSVAYAGLPIVKTLSFITRKPALYDKLYIDVLKDGNKVTSSTKAQEELGYTSRTLKETLHDTIHWLKSQQKI
ncbi:MAG TPA: NAD-dependent epimerase/dehydratase family protein [Brumimicrobium sp.]|nr:NAD-dependent epimerase/dehydratase family protein [Brumimicrobium sp.]